MSEEPPTSPKMSFLKRIFNSCATGRMSEDRVDLLAYIALRFACVLSFFFMAVLLILAYFEIVDGACQFFGLHLPLKAPNVTSSDTSNSATVKFLDALEYLWLALLIYLLPRAHAKHILSGIPRTTIEKSFPNIDSRLSEKAHEEFRATKSLSVTLLVAIVATWIIRELFHGSTHWYSLFIALLLILLLGLYYVALELLPSWKMHQHPAQSASGNADNVATDNSAEVQERVNLAEQSLQRIKDAKKSRSQTDAETGKSTN